MPAPNVDKYVARIEAVQTPADVDAVFNDIAAQKTVTRNAALNAIETLTLSELQSNITPADLFEMRASLEARSLVKNSIIGDFLSLVGLDDEMREDEKEGLDAMKLSAQIMLNLHQHKGEKASPVVKAFAAAAAKLSDAEYNTVEGQMKVLIETVASPAYAAPAAAAPQTAAPKAGNPFRKP